jgi:hypothetical protein
MQVRIIELKEEKNELLSYFEVEDNTRLNELFESFYCIKKLNNEVKDDVGLEINTNDDGQSLGDWYFIDSVSINVPHKGGETSPYIAVYVKEMY